MRGREEKHTGAKNSTTQICSVENTFSTKFFLLSGTTFDLGPYKPNATSEHTSNKNTTEKTVLPIANIFYYKLKKNLLI